MRCAPIWSISSAAETAVIENDTYSGCIPNMRAEKRRVMTPKKKETFSRVRTTLADCHETVSLVMRVDIWDNEI